LNRAVDLNSSCYNPRRDQERHTGRHKRSREGLTQTPNPAVDHEVSHHNSQIGTEEYATPHRRSSVEVRGRAQEDSAKQGEIQQKGQAGGALLALTPSRSDESN
jgi:hypothetical protein